MKKALSLAACSALVLGFAATASAVHIEAPAETSTVVAKGGLLTVDGAIRHRGYSETNSLRQNNDGSATAYDTRVQLGVTAQTSDAITGRILLENGFGNADTEAWGLTPMTNSLQTGGEKLAGLEILEAWVQYKPSNWGVKVGHMPLALGNKLFFDHTGSGDDAIVAFMNPTDATHLAALAIKYVEGTSGPDQDEIDGYVAVATHKVSDALNLGANYTYLHIGDNYTAVVNDSAGFSNLGLTIDGKVGGFTYGLNGEFQFGEWITDRNADLSLDDANGYALQGTIGMDLNGIALGALIGYGSGDDNATDGDTDTFVNFLTDTRYQSTIVGYRQATPLAAGDNTRVLNPKNTGLSNLTLFQLSAAGKTTCPLTGKDLALKVRGNYMKLNEVNKTVGGVEYDDSLGFELEGFADWSLGNGLVYGVEAAYLWAGDAWDSAPNAGDAEDGYYLRHRLELKF